MVRAPYRKRLDALDDFLITTRPLWEPQPFVTAEPAWCNHYPELTNALLALNENELKELNHTPDSLISLISGYLPELTDIPALIALPQAEKQPLPPLPSRLASGIPGRKWQQITALCSGIAMPKLPIIEWCGGKGYLGRLLATISSQPVTTLEQNEQLVQAGTRLAEKHSLNQRFKCIDVLTDGVVPLLYQHHAIALHACGDLHRTLVTRIIESAVPAFAIAPCCYHLGRDPVYTPFNHHLQLSLPREALRLAVNETVTAHNNEISRREKEMCYQLGFVLLRERYGASETYQPFMPVAKSWLNGGFADYCRRVAEREQLQLPEQIDWSMWEQQAEERRREVVRLELLRHAFRRVLELWLIMDIAVHLEAHDYEVNVATFCDRSTTPRNIVIEGYLKSR